MKHSRRDQADSSNKTGKKGRKLKKNQSLEACKCFTPFVKLHWWDCPEVNKPCPIHGNVVNQNMKPEKVEPDQNVTISFHPSSRTERLFEPVKALLAQCDPETKINFQYFSPECFKEKENLKNQTVQTSFEDLRKGNSNSIFVEKKKSSVYENTNKMKKLKECFHSPCNSIAQKYPSPTSVRRNFKENSLEESAQPWQKFFNGDIKYNQNSEWFASNPFGYKKLEKVPGDKRNSDFITVTQQDDKIINHKIYEIDHRKGFNENILSGLGNQQTQVAYSSFNVKYPNDYNKFNKMEDNRRQQEYSRKENRESFGNSQLSLSSGGSVYVTPFFLMPHGLQLTEDEESQDGVIEDGKRSIGVQVKTVDCDTNESKVITRYVQKRAYDSDSASEQKMNTVSLQTNLRGSKKISKYTDSSDDTLSEKGKYDGKVVQTNIHENVRISREKTHGGKKYKSTEVQTTNLYQVKEVLITRYNKPMKETGSQIQNSESEGPQIGSSKIQKPLTPRESSVENKQTQYESEEDMEYRNYDYESGFTKTGDKFQTSSSRSQDKSQNTAKAQNESKTSPVSDLSELKRLIFEFFDKATCQCKERENDSEKKNKRTISTMTDSTNTAKTPKSNENYSTKDKMVSKEIQTETGAKSSEAMRPNQNPQPAVVDDVNKIKTSDDTCPFCGRNILRLTINASTNTEDMYAIKEKTTIIETDVTEITKIKKKAGPKNPSRKSITSPTNQSVKPITYYRTDSQKIVKTIQAQNPSEKNIPLPTASNPSSTRNDSRSNIRPQSSSQRDKRTPSQTFRECRCNELNDMFISVQDTRYPLRTNKSNRQDDEPKERRDDQKQKNRHFYHVSVNPPWPRDLTNSWKSPEDGDDTLKETPKVFDKDGQQIDTYPLRLEEPQQNSESGKQQEKDRKHNKKDGFGLLRIPYSSASQVSISKGTHLQSKVIKSEESVNTLNQHFDCTAMKIFGDDTNDLFTVKSCHLNPIRIAYDDQSCDKLLTCSFCKSLMLLKLESKNDGVAYVPGLKDALTCQNPQSESDEVPERQSYEKFALLRENFDEQEELEKSSNSSDLSTRTNENFSKEGNSDLES